METLKSASKYVLGMAALWIIFDVLVGFSIVQSAALTLLTTFVIYGIRTSLGVPVWILRPYRIHIMPRWFQILSDLELIASPEEYDCVYERLKSHPPELYSVFRDGVCFTVLKSQAIEERTLIYSDNHTCFTARADFKENLAPPLMTAEKPDWDFQIFSPMLFVRGGTGYELGIIVDQWWWNRRKDRVTSKLGSLVADRIYDTDLIRLTLAQFPSTEFTVYWERLKAYPKGDRRLEKIREEDRAKLGWTPNTQLERLEHKYFTVWHHPI